MRSSLGSIVDRMRAGVTSTSPKKPAMASDAKVVTGSSFMDRARILFGMPKEITFEQASESATSLFVKVSVLPPKNASVILLDTATGRKYRVPLAQRPITFNAPLAWRDHALVTVEEVTPPTPQADNVIEMPTPVAPEILEAAKGIA